MVSRQYQHQFVATVGQQLQGGHGHGRRGIAAEGFEQCRVPLDADPLQLLVDDKAVLKVAHDQRALHTFEVQALQGLLEQRKLAGQGEELLGILLARKRPQA
ncbi:hypothetical protein D3C81_1995660 [compost metagenome]